MNRAPRVNGYANRDPIDPLAIQDRLSRSRLEQENAAFVAKLDSLFAKWEAKHNFRPGAGKILVPAGYRP